MRCISDRHPRYTAFEPEVPVWCVTPDVDGCVHRFFDASSISPSGRYAGLTRFRVEDRLVEPGDAADIVLVDLESGVQAETRGFDTQLFFNDVDINNDPPYPGPRRELRIDPHPAWDRSYRRIVFNGCHAGVRRVYLADLSAAL